MSSLTQMNWLDALVAMRNGATCKNDWAGDTWYRIRNDMLESLWENRKGSQWEKTAIEPCEMKARWEIVEFDILLVGVSDNGN